ncbi:MAG: D-glycero-beta-D-manno-heptose 1-phosphate adenylyltransferase [Candidatus Aminicenantales bacterium]
MAHKKTCSLSQLEKIRKRLKKQGQKVVFTNGCFDLIHGGHIYLFKKAKSLGDVLIVAVNDDASLRKIKGPSRPVFPLNERLEVLAAMECIDYLTAFSEETPQKIISVLLPDILVKGGDWRPDEVVGRKEVEEAGGRVVILPYLKGRSSTSVIRKILKSIS